MNMQLGKMSASVGPTPQGVASAGGPRWALLCAALGRQPTGRLRPRADVRAGVSSSLALYEVPAVRGNATPRRLQAAAGQTAYPDTTRGTSLAMADVLSGYSLAESGVALRWAQRRRRHEQRNHLRKDGLGRTLPAQEFEAKDAEHDERDASDAHDG